MVRALLLVAGVVMLAGAVVRRAQLVRRRKEQIAVGLRSDDPARRAAALEAISAVGIRPFGDVLRARVAELDAGAPEARELVDVIARCQWEPADHPVVVELRWWANSIAASAEPPPPPPVVDVADLSAEPLVVLRPADPAPVPVSSDIRERVAAVLGVTVDRVRFVPFEASGGRASLG